MKNRIVTAHISELAYRIYKKTYNHLDYGWFSKWVNERLISEFKGDINKFKKQILKEQLNQLTNQRNELDNKIHQLANKLKKEKGGKNRVQNKV